MSGLTGIDWLGKHRMRSQTTNATSIFETIEYPSRVAAALGFGDSQGRLALGTTVTPRDFPFSLGDEVGLSFAPLALT